MTTAKVSKAQLFGGIRKRKFVGNLEPDLRKLSAPMKHKGAARVFCRGCGHYAEIDEKGALALSNRAKEKQQSNTNIGRFFTVTSCYMCNDTKKFEEPEIVQIH